MFTLAQQPLSIGKVLDSGVKLYLSSFSKFILLSIIYAGLNIFLTEYTYSIEKAGYTDTNIPAIITLVLISIVIFFVLYIAIFYRIGGVAAGRVASIGDSLKFGLRKTIPFFIASLLYGLAVMLGMILFVIPGFILMLSLILYTPAMLLDGGGIISSLTKSHNLIWGNWWRTATIFFIPTAIITVMIMGLLMFFGPAIGFGALQQADPTALRDIERYYNLSASVVTAVITPLFYTITIVVYHDLKLRKSGGDLAARMQ